MKSGQTRVPEAEKEVRSASESSFPWGTALPALFWGRSPVHLMFDGSTDVAMCVHLNQELGLRKDSNMTHCGCVTIHPLPAPGPATRHPPPRPRPPMRCSGPRPTNLVGFHHSLGHREDGLDVVFSQFVCQLAHRRVVLEGRSGQMPRRSGTEPQVLRLLHLGPRGLDPPPPNNSRVRCQLAAREGKFLDGDQTRGH